MVLLLQPAARIICDTDGSALWIMSEINLMLEGANFGAIRMWPFRMMIGFFLYRKIIF